MYSHPVFQLRLLSLGPLGLVPATGLLFFLKKVPTVPWGSFFLLRFARIVRREARPQVLLRCAEVGCGRLCSQMLFSPSAFSLLHLAFGFLRFYSMQSLLSGLFVCGGERSDANRNHAKLVSIAEKVAAEQRRGPAAPERNVAYSSACINFLFPHNLLLHRNIPFTGDSRLIGIAEHQKSKYQVFIPQPEIFFHGRMMRHPARTPQSRYAQSGSAQ